jgi:aerobic-type carbon monoxide dehydrogenase small subunit (CoxS/CutS family)
MLTLKINDAEKAVDAPADMPLLWVLRDILGMTGTKFENDRDQSSRRAPQRPLHILEQSRW